MPETKGAQVASKKAKETAHEDYPGGSPRVGWRTWSDAVFEGQERTGDTVTRGPGANSASGAGYATGPRRGAGGCTCRARPSPCPDSEEDSFAHADRLATG